MSEQARLSELAQPGAGAAGTAEPERAPGPGPVVLDIGGSVGAAVVSTPACFRGREVEIRAGGSAWDGRHVAVHDREVAAGRVDAAVFPDLEEGTWEVRLRDTPSGPTAAFAVVGGRVTYVPFGEGSPG